MDVLAERVMSGELIPVSAPAMSPPARLKDPLQLPMLLILLILFPLFPSCMDGELCSIQAPKPQAQPDEWKDPGHKDQDGEFDCVQIIIKLHRTREMPSPKRTCVLFL